LNELVNPPDVIPPAAFIRDRPRSAYIHVPFCHHRCGYCDFTLITKRRDLVPRYLAALKSEITRQFIGDDQLPTALETLYLGGGTPTYLDSAELRQLGTTLNRFFTLIPHAEWTVEANPSGLDPARIDALAEIGVNRISLGVQSFDDRYLKVLERDHSYQDIVSLMPQLQAHFPSISIDLIFAVPGQTLREWEETLKQAIALQPQHLSTYCLTIEKGTSFWTRRENGELIQAMDSVEGEMYLATQEILKRAGYEHYEISSFARPGCRSKHNQVYWQAKPYWAFGPGASNFLSGIRHINDRSVTRWLQLIEAGESGVMERDELPLEERLLELLVIGLRQLEGVDAKLFHARTGHDLFELVPQTVQQLVTKGWLEVTPESIRVSSTGLMYYDSIAGELLCGE
jgi:oxygen-independent coproporphyrinogen-3 oxidase